MTSDVIIFKNVTKEKLIQTLIKDGYLKTPAIIEAFETIDRKDFVPESLKTSAYANHPLPIGHGQTISQPLTVVFMLELLEPKPGEIILDVGAGSGWTAALLAQSVGEKGTVIALEKIPELVEVAKNNIGKYGFLEKGRVKIIEGDGSKGYLDNAPYDKIIAAATANEIPKAWKEQLKLGGRIVAPVGQSIVVLEKKGHNEFEKKQFFGFSFVPLITE